MWSKYQCTNCGKVFSDEDAGVRTECVGEFWGTPAFDSYMVCPECGEDCYEEISDTEAEILENIENGNTESSEDEVICPCCGVNYVYEDDEFYEISKEGIHTCLECGHKFVLSTSEGKFNTEVYYE